MVHLRLPYPLYAVCVSTVSPHHPVGSPRRSATKPMTYIAAGGGGGSSRSGISNGFTLLSHNGEIAGQYDTGKEIVMSLSSHPSKDLIACGAGQSCLLLEIPILKKMRRIALDHDVRIVKFSRCGDRIAIGLEDGTLRLHLTQGGRKLCDMQGHHAPVIDVDFHLNGAFVASVDSNGMGNVWQADGTLIHSITAPMSKPYKLRSCKFLEDKILAMQCAGHNPTYLSHISLTDFSETDRVMVSNRPQTILSVSNEGDIAIGDSEGSVCINQTTWINPHGFFVSSAAFSPSSSFLVSVSGDCTLNTEYFDKESVNTAPPSRTGGYMAMFILIVAFILAIYLI